MVGQRRPATDRFGPAAKGGGLIYPPRQAGAFLTVEWPDRSYALITAYAATLTVIVVAAPVHDGKLAGILGNDNGNPADDLAAGTKGTDPPDYDDLHPAFADSLRIDQAQSLFRYDAGRKTGTYTDRTFPDRNVPTPARHAWAAAMCVRFGVSESISLQNCIVDLEQTGTADFLVASLATQSSLRNLPSAGAPGGDVGTLDITRPGERKRVPFSGTAGQKIYVDVLSSTLPGGCGWLTVQNAAGEVLGSGCVVSGKGGVDALVLPATGGYFVVVQPPGQSTGSISIRVVTGEDQRGSLTIDGPATGISVDSAGSVGRLSFTGRKGQIVYVDITASSFDSACGLISLRNAQDDTLTSGCVISGKGFLDRTVLPADGSYTIVLDPAGNATGSLRLKLTGAQDQSVESAVDEPSRHLAVAQAGARAVLSFAATTGEKVYVNVPSTTVADQCGALSLHAPDGETIGTGCLIGRRGGIDAVELKQTGVFTVVLDPVAGNTGSALVGVTKAVDQRGVITADGRR